MQHQDNKATVFCDTCTGFIALEDGHNAQLLLKEYILLVHLNLNVQTLLLGRRRLQDVGHVTN